jgi:hypothetical protein
MGVPQHTFPFVWRVHSLVCIGITLLFGYSIAHLTEIIHATARKSTLDNFKRWKILAYGVSTYPLSRLELQSVFIERNPVSTSIMPTQLGEGSWKISALLAAPRLGTANWTKTWVEVILSPAGGKSVGGSGQTVSLPARDEMREMLTARSHRLESQTRGFGSR